LVPVNKQARHLSLAQISVRAAELAALARAGRLSAGDMEGGTFTVSNLGMYGVSMFTPIINPPEAGILGVCAIADVLKLENEKPVNRRIMGLSLSFDHRVLDGAEAAAFLKMVQELLESPLRILL
jgi:pyruvate dehydrogenase E2 component (dihydrolipoamide acetyltransferase)